MRSCPDMRPNELNGADFIGYDGPPAIVVKPGEMVTVPVFVSHFSDRTYAPTAPVVGHRLGRQRRPDQPRRSPSRGRRRWTPYDVTEQEPLTFRAPNGRSSDR